MSWCETQSIYHLTVTDFAELLREKGVRIERSRFFAREMELGPLAANWCAEHAVYQLSR